MYNKNYAIRLSIEKRLDVGFLWHGFYFWDKNAG